MTRLLIAACLALSLPGEIVDRIAVTVDRHVISESDILRDLKITAMLDGRSIDSSTTAKRNAAERMVDQYLLLNDAGPSGEILATATDVAGAVEQYRDALTRYGVTEAELTTHLLLALRALRFAELRFSREGELSESALDEWLSGARAGVRIVYREAVFP